MSLLQLRFFSSQSELEPDASRRLDSRSHYIGPIEGSQPGSEAWTDGMSHEGWLELTKYFVGRFKGESKEVSVDPTFPLFLRSREAHLSLSFFCVADHRRKNRLRSSPSSSLDGSIQRSRRASQPFPSSEFPSLLSRPPSSLFPSNSPLPYFLLSPLQAKDLLSFTSLLAHPSTLTLSHTPSATLTFSLPKGYYSFTTPFVPGSYTFVVSRRLHGEEREVGRGSTSVEGGDECRRFNFNFKTGVIRIC